MPDITSMIKALKMSRIKRLWYKHNNFTNFAKTCTNIENNKEFLSQKYDMKYVKQKIPKFYHEIFDNWFALYATSPKSSEDILMERLWNNKHILIDKKPALYPSWKQQNILTINHLLNQEGNFKPIADLQAEFNINIKTMQ